MKNAIVFIKEKHLRLFRQRARKSPVEIGALLVGEVVAPNVYKIINIIYPDIESASKVHVNMEASAVELLHVAAKLAGLAILGTLHSHINAPPILSPTDYISHKAFNDVISGVVAIPEKGISLVCFWRTESALPCYFEYYTDKKWGAALKAAKRLLRENAS